MYAVIKVARHESHVIRFLRDLGHSNGDVYFLRSGRGGGSDDLGDTCVEGWGSSVSKVK